MLAKTKGEVIIFPCSACDNGKEVREIAKEVGASVQERVCYDHLFAVEKREILAKAFPFLEDPVQYKNLKSRFLRSSLRCGA